ncbi:MAG: alpha-mannosidase [Actinobacteria bacterium]|nr:alpha-mannosidase [Actinomycetota bacterium]
MRRVAIVPHTHWDREWYAPFQTFRLRLVELLDSFLPALERDLSYAHFLLDGQMAVVDDYLEVRPEEEERLRRLAASGRLSMGPWYILMDEFLVSGETIVRNLQRGLTRAAAFGGASPVGYLPDMFGHIAQMPQLLQQAGMAHTVVWRGVPSAVDRNAFWWSAPDGSTVRAEFMPKGYGNGAAIPDDAKALVRRIAAHDAEVGSFLLDGMLWMNGTDHQVPQPWLGRVVAEANDIQSDYRLEVTSLAAYLADAPTEGLPSWTGELRSGAMSNLLMGVGSNRVDVKQAAARAERSLERRAEPLCALFFPASSWPGSLLDLAWREVIRNSAHDSVCACSADEAVDAVLVRYAEARQIAEGLAARAVDAVGASMANAGVVVVNASPRTRGGLVELLLPGDGPVSGAQVLRSRTATLAEHRLSGRELGGILGQIRSQQLDEDTYVNAIRVEETDDGLDIVIEADARLRTEFLVEEAKRDLYARAGANPDAPVRVRIEQPPSRRVLVRVDDVPGFGWKLWEMAPATVEPVVVGDDGMSMANGLVSAAVDSGDGTFSVDGVAGFDRLVDSLDCGDTYNYCPPENDVVVDTPSSVDVRVLERGPIRARLEVTRSFTWQDRAVVVVTVLELQAGERAVRVHTTFDNPVGDHRLRAVFPIPDGPVSSSSAECAFAVVTRGLTAEGGPSELGLPTFPSRRFVRAGALTVVHEGLLEYEVVDEGRALALTLLRATGMLSRVELAYRPLPAGPPIPLDGPQMLGRCEARYAVCTDPDADPFALVDDMFLPLEVVSAPGGGTRPDTGSALSVTGAEVSAVVRVDDGLEVRVFNPTPSPTVVSFGPQSGWLVDLVGRPLAPFDGSFELRAFGIATARL